MANRNVEEALRADLLLSSHDDGESEVNSAAQRPKQYSLANPDPVMESLLSIQKTLSMLSGEIRDVEGRLLKVEGKVKRFNPVSAKEPEANQHKTTASKRPLQPQSNGAPSDDCRRPVVPSKTGATSTRALFDDKKISMGVRDAVSNSDHKAERTSKGKTADDAQPPQKNDKKQRLAKPHNETAPKEVAPASKSEAVSSKPTPKQGADVSHAATAKVKSVLLLPLNVSNKGEHSKKYIELSDDSDDSYDEVFRRSEPINGPEVEIDEIMHKAASFRAADLKGKDMGAGYRRMISTSAGRICDPQPVHKEVEGKASALKLPVVRAVPVPMGSPAAVPVRVADKRPMRENADILPKRQRTISSDSDKSFAELLASVQRMPDTPTPPRPAVSAEMAMAAAKSTAQKSEKGGGNQVRVRTNPEKVSSGRIGVPIVAAPPMVGNRPKSGPVTVTAPNLHVKAPAAEIDARDPTRSTELIEVAKRVDGKEVCLEGELKREKGETVPYINLVLATGGRATKRSLKFSMRATTMAKLVRGEAFNEVMMGLRELDPTNRNCELWV